MQVDYVRDEFTQSLDHIKSSVFRHDPDDPIVFHRKEILGLKGPYGCLRDPEKKILFDRLALNLFQASDYTVITALIDKFWMVQQKHWASNEPYHFLMEIMVEKYTQFLERKGAIGDIMPESRQGKDSLLQKTFDKIREGGTAYVNSQRIQSAIRSSKLKFRTKSHNIAGLQLCDLIAHPSHIFARWHMDRNSVSFGPFSSQVVSILCRSKYDRSERGGIIGYGVKHLPR